MNCQKCGKPISTIEIAPAAVGGIVCEECYYTAIGDVMEEPEKDPKYESKRKTTSDVG